MGIRGEWINYGEGSGYFAKPERAMPPLPGVLVIQEIGGVNGQIEDVTRRIAAAGYAALAPDLYAVEGRRPEALTRERIAEAFGFGATLPPGTMFDPVTREAELAKLGEADSTTRDVEGRLNAAPFSGINYLTLDPAIVALGVANREGSEASPKDTARNLGSTREFVINIVTEDIAQEMNVSPSISLRRSTIRDGRSCGGDSSLIQSGIKEAHGASSS